MSVLTTSQITEALALAKSGQTLKSIGDRYGVTEQAIWYWVKTRKLNGDSVRRMRFLDRRNRLLERRERTRLRLLRASAGVFRLFEPSSDKRMVLLPAICARYQLSKRAVKQLIGVSSSAGENKRVVLMDAIIMKLMRDFLKTNPRAGFPMIFKALLKHGPGTRAHAFRVYNEFFKERRLQREAVGRSSYKKRMKIPSQINWTWSADFMQAALPSGERFWIFNVIDDFNREALISKVILRKSAVAVTRILDEEFTRGRKPASIRSDNGGEFVSNVYKKWSGSHGISRIYTRYRSPNDNCLIETFNGRMRLELLNCFKFRTFDEAQSMIDDWCLRYNFARPQAGLGDLSPMQFAWIARRMPVN